MALNQWNENILILELLDEPDFSEDTDSILSNIKNEKRFISSYNYRFAKCD